MQPARAVLAEAEKISQSLDSPWLRVQQLFTAALLHEKLKEPAKAKLEQALQICYDHGFDDSERQFDLVKAALYN